MVFKPYPARDELEELVGAQHPLPVRIANLRPLYDAINERDHEIERLNRRIEKQGREEDRLKGEITKLKGELRARPKTPAQLQGLIRRSEFQQEAIVTLLAQAQEMRDQAARLVESLEEAATAPD